MARRFTLEFLKTETASGAILALAALLGIVAANSPWRDAYGQFLHSQLPVRIGGWAETHANVEWIKEGLMAVFFYVVGLEIKYEATKGELSTPRKLAMPVLCAAGGMIAPALIYSLINLAPGGTLKGWPVPVATDIAFALAALAIFGRNTSPALRTFLLALAVADDLGAVVLIAILFTHQLDVQALMGAGVGLTFLALLSRWKTAPLMLYVIGALVVWAFTLRSGVSTSVAAVAAALWVPVNTPEPGRHSMLERLNKALHPYVAYFILPLFAFAAAGFSVSDLAGGAALSPLAVGIVAGLLIGKPLGIFGAAAIGARLKLVHKPSGGSWSELFAVTCLCGVGFTMSLFLGSLAFPPGDLAEQGAVRLGVIVGSLSAVLLGGLLLRKAQARRPPMSQTSAV